MMTIKIFLFILILNTVQAKTYKRCDFIKELVEKYNFKEEDAAKVSCIAKKSVFETDRVIYPEIADEEEIVDEPEIVDEESSSKPSYGIFQISSEIWCSEKEIGGICNLNCKKLIDDDISDDIECLQKIVPNFEDGEWGSPWRLTEFYCEEKEIIDNCAKNDNSENPTWKSLDDCIHNFPEVHPIQIIPAFGGIRAIEFEFSHAAAIGWSRSKSNDINWDCGGSLISEDIVMTASHCMNNKENQKPDVVRFGALDLKKKMKNNNEQQFRISSIIRHPDYKPRYNDIGLIKLEKKVTITEAVIPACLWTKQEIPDRVPLEACGFGQTEFAGRSALTLMKIIVSTIGTEECQSHYDDDRNLRKKGLVERIHLCANDKTGRNMDTCEGDSGGPLEMKLGYPNEASNYQIPFVVGVTSFGKGCGFYSPGVYTRVSSYIDWIKQHVPDLEVNPIKCSKKFLKFRQQKLRVEVNLKASDNVTPFLPSKTIISTSDGQTSKATIIADKFLLTTASSLNKPSFNPDRVQLDTDSSQIIIDKIIYHPNYVRGDTDNDLAVIKLKSRITWVDEDFPACLNKKGFEGKLFQEETYSDNKNQLQYGDFYKVSIDFNKTNCQEKEDVICLKSDAYLVPNVCKVSQGSPVIEKFLSKNVFQSIVKGFAVQSQDCTFTTATDISKHYDWINSVVFGTLDQNMLSRNYLPGF